jgi:hypothetical protein
MRIEVIILGVAIFCVIVYLVYFYTRRDTAVKTEPYTTFLNPASHTPRVYHPPVDLVYLWVDGSDPVWAAKRDKEADKDTTLITPKEPSRSRNSGELLYSLRSVYKFLRDSSKNKWYNKIYLIVDHQKPSFLASHPDIVLIEQNDLFPDKSHLPVFNSQAIECWMHRIPGLSERYIYLNDDMMFGAPTRYEDLFDDNDEPIRLIQKHTPSINTASPFMNSVGKARDLIRNTFNEEPPSPSHFPRAFRKSTVNKCVETFQNAFTTTSRSKFRDYTDTCIVFLMELFDYEYRKLNGQNPSVEIGDGGFVSVTDHHQFNMGQCISAMYSPPHKFLCFNDDSPTGEGFSSIKGMWQKFLYETCPYENTPILSEKDGA